MDLNEFVSKTVSSESILVAVSNKPNIVGITPAETSDEAWKEDALKPNSREEYEAEAEGSSNMDGDVARTPDSTNAEEAVHRENFNPCGTLLNESSEMPDEAADISSLANYKCHTSGEKNVTKSTSKPPVEKFEPHTPDRSLLLDRSGSNARPAGIERMVDIQASRSKSRRNIICSRERQIGVLNNEQITTVDATPSTINTTPNHRKIR